MKQNILSILILASLPSLAQLEIPASSSQCQIIKHQYYTLCYNEQHEQASWVAYSLSGEMLQGSAERKDNFRADSKVTTGSAQLIDYRGSGYDRGHLAPAADMKVNATAMSESFFMSNMSPQEPGFNRGVWKELEEMLRNRARFHSGSGKGFYIVIGPILREGLPTIGPNKVSVPEYYYKVVYDPYFEDKYAGIAFLIPNKSSSLSPNDESFLVSIDNIEELTGIDFFPMLDDKLENSIESNDTWLNYPVGGTKINTIPSQEKGRCQATTQAGTQCKRNSETNSNFCWQHR